MTGPLRRSADLANVASAATVPDTGPAGNPTAKSGTTGGAWRHGKRPGRKIIAGGGRDGRTNMTTDATTMEAVLLTAEQSWMLCGLGKSSWYKNMSAGRIPAPVRIGGALRWRRDELLAWIDAGCPPMTRWNAMAGKKKSGKS